MMHAVWYDFILKADSANAYKLPPKIKYYMLCTRVVIAIFNIPKRPLDLRTFTY